MRRRKAGFTLVELMIVIAIIAVLASIMLPSFMHVRAQAQLVGCEQNEKNIGTAVELFATENGNIYPTNLPAMIPAHFSRLPTCPTSGQEYDYQDSVNPRGYTVICTEGGHSPCDVLAGYPQYGNIGGLVER